MKSTQYIFCFSKYLPFALVFWRFLWLLLIEFFLLFLVALLLPRPNLKADNNLVGNQKRLRCPRFWSLTLKVLSLKFTRRRLLRDCCLLEFDTELVLTTGGGSSSRWCGLLLPLIKSLHIMLFWHYFCGWCFTILFFHMLHMTKPSFFDWIVYQVTVSYRYTADKDKVFVIFICCIFSKQQGFGYPAGLGFPLAWVMK